MARRKKLPPSEESHFSEAFLFKTLEDLQTSRNPTTKVTYSDDRVFGLRFVIHKTGEIAYRVTYKLALTDQKPEMKIGTATPGPEYCTLDHARERARIVKELGEKGVDVRDGMHLRLYAELDRDGTMWTPALSPPKLAPKKR
jgi:hypothetical protein